jgi:hypothetical protein
MCVGGTQCLKKDNERKCYPVQNKLIGQECSYDEECVLSGLSCQNKLCTRVPQRPEPCPNSEKGTNCTRDEVTDERCVCGEGNEKDKCLAQRNNACFGITLENTLYKWSQCWKDNNCPLEKSWTTAFFVDSMQTEYFLF